jgi:hypothetical protein
VGVEEGQGGSVSGGCGGELGVGEVAAVVADDSDMEGVGVGVGTSEQLLVGASGVFRGLCCHAGERLPSRR